MRWLIGQLSQHFVNTEQEHKRCIQWLMLSGHITITYTTAWIYLVYIWYHNEYVTMRHYWPADFAQSSRHSAASMNFVPFSSSDRHECK